jgi:uncharacterized membrane protein YfcA
MRKESLLFWCGVALMAIADILGYGLNTYDPRISLVGVLGLSFLLVSLWLMRRKHKRVEERDHPIMV